MFWKNIDEHLKILIEDQSESGESGVLVVVQGGEGRPEELGFRERAESKEK